MRGMVRRWEERESDPVSVTWKFGGKLDGRFSSVVRLINSADFSLLLSLLSL